MTLEMIYVNIHIDKLNNQDSHNKDVILGNVFQSERRIRFSGMRIHAHDWPKL